MKFLIISTFVVLIALSAPAFAINDSNTTAVDGSVAFTGNMNHGSIYNGTGAGSTSTNTLTNTSNNVNVNSATGGKADSSSYSSAKQHQKQSQNQGQYQSSTSSVKGSGNSENANTAVVNQNYKRNPVSTAYSAPLVAADDTCMGSSSVGGQGVGFGLSFGSTWKDEDCVRRKDARELHNMGQKAAAVSLMCQNANVRKAMKAAGAPCVGSEEEVAWTGESAVTSFRPENGSRNR